MEDVLDLYAEAPDPKRPVVCFDESPDPAHRRKSRQKSLNPFGAAQSFAARRSSAAEWRSLYFSSVRLPNLSVKYGESNPSAFIPR
jgi:hypothetical protein